MLLATRPVEAPGAASDLKTTSQDSSQFPTADRPEIQPPGTASQTFTSDRPEVQSPGPSPSLLLC